MIKRQNCILVLAYLVLSLIFGCSFLTKKVEQLSTPIVLENRPAKIFKKNLNCFENNKVQLLLEDDATFKFYTPLLATLFETNLYSFIQKAAMLSLIEMGRRPDKATPSARLQYYLRFNNKNYYFDFHPKNLADDTKASYLKGIDHLLKTYDKSKRLNQLADILDRHIPKTMGVSPDLESFLLVHKNDLFKSDVLSDTFLKGDEPLTKHESFNRINFKKLIDLYYKQNLSIDSDYEFSKNGLVEIFPRQSGMNLNCNTDINIESSFQGRPKIEESANSHYFAIKDGDNYFIAVSSVLTQKTLTNFNSTYFFKSLPSSSPLPICQFHNPIQDIVLFSSSGRNPAQHLKHLVNYDINLVDSLPSLDELLKFSRHIFLNNPDRILYESKRGRKSQLDFFLSMNFPIYHVDSLGDIIGMANFKNGKNEEKSLISDDRSMAKLWCGP